MSEAALHSVLFDLDGTLIDSIELIERSYRHTLSVHTSRVYDRDEWLGGLGRALKWQLEQGTSAADKIAHRGVARATCFSALMLISACRAQKPEHLPPKAPETPVPSLHPAPLPEPVPIHLADGPPWGTNRSCFFGRIVHAVGDYDGDGLADIAVGMPFINDLAGAVRVFSSKSNAPLFDLPGSGTSYFGVDLSGLEDIDDDGVDDVAVTRYGPGSWEAIISMKSRRELFSAPARAEEVLVCRDLDGDGTRDLLLTGKSSKWADSKTQAVSGKNGERITSNLPAAIDSMIPVRTRSTNTGLRTMGLVFKPEGEVEYYDCLASLDQPVQRAHYLKSEIEHLSKPRFDSDGGALWSADFDGDGVFDLVELRAWDRVGEPGTDCLALKVLGSRNGGVLFERKWPADTSPPDCLANCIGLPGDLNADSIPDLIIGVPFAWVLPAGVFAISGADGSSIWRVAPLKEVGPNGSDAQYSRVEIGVSLSILDDLDGDRVDDLVVGCGDYHFGAGIEQVGVVLTLSGRTGKEIRRILETDQPDTLK